MTTTSKPRRRWFQYSLRTLLVLMLLACIGMGWFAVKMQQVKKERAAVAAIEGLGGWVTDVTYRYHPDGQRGRAWLRKWLGDDFFARPYEVRIPNDAAMEYLTGVRQLRELNLEGIQVTDAGLKNLKGLTQLLLLRIERAPVTDAGLEFLKGLARLQTLSLAGTQVTDAGLEQLKELTQLLYLDLAGTQVTDAGLEHLKGLTQLDWLYLGGTQVTDAGSGASQGIDTT